MTRPREIANEDPSLIWLDAENRYFVVNEETAGTPGAEARVRGGDAPGFPTLSAAESYAMDHAMDYHYGLAVVDPHGNDCQD